MFDHSIPRFSHCTSRSPQAILPLAPGLLAVWSKLVLGITIAMAVVEINNTLTHQSELQVSNFSG